MLIWILSTFEDWTYHGWFHQLKGIGTFFGVGGYLCLSISLFLASRWSKLEEWFGGLDQIYHLHHQIGLWGCLFIFVHPLILAVRWLPWDVEKFLWFIFPIHHRSSVNFGSFAFFLLLILIAITSLKLFPYDKWKLTHRFMSLVFILATLHVLFSDRRFSSSYLSFTLLLIPMGFGFFGIVYKQIYSEFIIKHPEFKVVGTEALNDNLIQVFITSEAKKLNFIPGQYVFCRFEAEQITSESHPFTLCGSPNDSVLSILVKIRGDFTRSIYHHLKAGARLFVEGPYGKFDYTKSGPSQIWIAGGIGIVPFLAWARLFNSNKDRFNSIYLFHCIHRKADAVFAEEFNRLSKAFPFFHFLLFCTEQSHRLNVEKVEELTGGLLGKKILMCGPRVLTRDFTKSFQKKGVSQENIYFEDFEFF